MTKKGETWWKKEDREKREREYRQRKAVSVPVKTTSKVDEVASRLIAPVSYIPSNYMATGNYTSPNQQIKTGGHTFTVPTRSAYESMSKKEQAAARRDVARQRREQEREEREAKKQRRENANAGKTSYAEEVQARIVAGGNGPDVVQAGQARGQMADTYARQMDDTKKKEKKQKEDAAARYMLDNPVKRLAGNAGDKYIGDVTNKEMERYIYLANKPTLTDAEKKEAREAVKRITYEGREPVEKAYLLSDAGNADWKRTEGLYASEPWLVSGDVRRALNQKTNIASALIGGAGGSLPFAEKWTEAAEKKGRESTGVDNVSPVVYTPEIQQVKEAQPEAYAVGNTVGNMAQMFAVGGLATKGASAATNAFSKIGLTEKAAPFVQQAIHSLAMSGYVTGKDATSPEYNPQNTGADFLKNLITFGALGIGGKVAGGAMKGVAGIPGAVARVGTQAGIGAGASLLGEAATYNMYDEKDRSTPEEMAQGALTMAIFGAVPQVAQELRTGLITNASSKPVSEYFSKIKSAEELKAEYRTLAKQYHPDKGGDPAIFQQISAEYDAMTEYLKQNPAAGGDGNLFARAVNRIKSWIDGLKNGKQTAQTKEMTALLETTLESAGANVPAVQAKAAVQPGMVAQLSNGQTVRLLTPEQNGMVMIKQEDGTPQFVGAENVRGGAGKAPQVQEKTAGEEATVPPEMPLLREPTQTPQETIDAYRNAVDSELMNFYANMVKLDPRTASKSNYTIDTASPQAVNDIERLIGQNAKGYNLNLNGSNAQHMEKQHPGADPLDVGRIKWVIDNRDLAYQLIDKNGKPELSANYKNSDGSRAQMVAFAKQVNGTHYIVVAVPNTAKQNVEVVTAYKSKSPNKKGTAQESGAPNGFYAPDVTSETDPASVPFNQMISQNEENVNPDELDARIAELAAVPDKTREQWDEQLRLRSERADLARDELWKMMDGRPVQGAAAGGTPVTQGDLFKTGNADANRQKIKEMEGNKHAAPAMDAADIDGAEANALFREITGEQPEAGDGPGPIEDLYADIRDRSGAELNQTLKESYSARDVAEEATQLMEKKGILSPQQIKVGDAIARWADPRIYAPGIVTDAVMDYAQAKETVLEATRTIDHIREMRKAAQYEEAEAVTKNSYDWKDKKAGLLYAREIQEHNIDDIALKNDPEGAEAVKRTYFEPVHAHEAEGQRFIKQYRDRVKALGLTPAESVLAQAYGEGLIPETQLDDYRGNNSSIQITGENKDKVYDRRFSGKNGNVDVGKVKNAVVEFRAIYNELLDRVNEVLLENGYAPIQGRKDYFPHFSTKKGIVDTVLAKLGVDTNNTDGIPEDIAGLTHNFKPGKKFFQNFLQRQGNTTDYDALYGFDRYIEGIKDVIFHTEDIQKLRALETVLRGKHTDETIQQKLREIYTSDMPDGMKESAAGDLLEKTSRGNLPNYITNIADYIDVISGKKSFGDRNMERKLNRNAYSVMRAMEGRVASNMIGYNVGSWLTNFIPLAQANGQIGTKYMLQGAKDTIKSWRRKDGFVDESDFLTNRRGTDRLSLTPVDKFAQAGVKPMEWIDNFVSETITRAKYKEGMAEGLTHAEAMRRANDTAAKVLADRSYGAMPTLFNEKNPVTKLLTMFQLEVNNQYSNLFKDMPRQAKQKGIAWLVAGLAQYMIGAWLYNEIYEKLTGRRAAFDPIDIGISAINDFNNPDMSKGDAAWNTVSNVAEDIPFVGGILGGGRVPISSALPFAGKLEDVVKNIGMLADENVSENRKKEVLEKELSKPAFYFLPPSGGGAAKKAVEGLRTLGQGGEYTYDKEGNKKLKFASDATPKDYAQAALFGKYATDAGRDYINDGFNGLTAKQTATYDKLVGTGVKPRQAEDVMKRLAAVEGETDSSGEAIEGSKAKQQMALIDKQKLSAKQKYLLYADVVFSDKERDELDTAVEDFGISEKDVMEAYREAKAIKANVDAEGKTVTNTLGLKKKDIINGLGLDENQTKYLYEALDVGKKVSEGTVTWDTVGKKKEDNSERGKYLAAAGVTPTEKKEEKEETAPQPREKLSALQEKTRQRLESKSRATGKKTVAEKAPAEATAVQAEVKSEPAKKPSIKGAEKEDIKHIPTDTFRMLDEREINPYDYQYVKNRISAFPDKVHYLQEQGFEGKQLNGMVEKLVMGETAKGKMTAAGDMGIDNDTYIGAYINGYNSIGSKAERNEQIREYVDGLKLTQDQKDALYDWVKVYKGKSGSGEGQEEGEGSSSKKSSGRRRGSGRRSGGGSKGSSKATYKQAKTVSPPATSKYSPQKYSASKYSGTKRASPKRSRRAAGTKKALPVSGSVRALARAALGLGVKDTIVSDTRSAMAKDAGKNPLYMAKQRQAVINSLLGGKR